MLLIGRRNCHHGSSNYKWITADPIEPGCTWSTQKRIDTRTIVLLNIFFCFYFHPAQVLLDLFFQIS